MAGDYPCRPVSFCKSMRPPNPVKERSRSLVMRQPTPCPALAFRLDCPQPLPAASVDQNAKDASGACCPGGVGMEVGKGQQAGARTKQAAVYPHHCGQDERLSGKRLWAFIQTTADTNRPLNSTSEEEWPSMTPSQKQTGGVLMKNDFEVKLYMSERRKGMSQKNVLIGTAGIIESDNLLRVFPQIT